MNNLNCPDQERKISLMIVGAQKAGTTSLKNYLGQHPSLHTHPHKEFSYFFDPEENALGFDAAFRRYFSVDSPDVRLIAKNAGIYINENGISRIKEHNPDCKLVLLLRNPVERTYSSYLMEKNYGAIHAPFESIEPILHKGNSDDWRYEFFIGMSLYSKHIEMILRHFPKEQLKIFRYRDFVSNASAICTDIFSWMNVDPSFLPDTSKRHNVTRVNRSYSYGKFIIRLLNNQNAVKKIARKFLPGKMDYKMGEMLRGVNRSNKAYEPMSQRMASVLTEFYKPYNAELSRMTGIDFSDWNQYTPHQ